MIFTKLSPTTNPQLILQWPVYDTPFPTPPELFNGRGIQLSERNTDA